MRLNEGWEARGCGGCMHMEGGHAENEARRGLRSRVSSAPPAAPSLPPPAGAEPADCGATPEGGELTVDYTAVYTCLQCNA